MLLEKHCVKGLLFPHSASACLADILLSTSAEQHCFAWGYQNPQSRRRHGESLIIRSRIALWK
jgi:hypothetical protein